MGKRPKQKKKQNHIPMSHLRLLASTHGTFSTEGKDTGQRNYASKNVKKNPQKKRNRERHPPPPPSNPVQKEKS
jgi:hypothetical protein